MTGPRLNETSVKDGDGSAGENGRLGVRQLVGILQDRFEFKKTVLAVCPNSRDVTRAALYAAKEANAPLLLAATLNQVDRDGGYTGWTPTDLMSFVAAESKAIGLEAPVFTCLDHGGPWLKDKHRSQELGLDEAMRAVKESLEACIDAGYSLLHIDPTVDPSFPEGEPIPIELVVERTVDLIDHSETYRQNRDLPEIGYEVGTEEVHGGLADMANFDAFLHGLNAALKSRGLEKAWPSFVVGKVGTDLHTSYFEPEVARRLTEKVKPYGALIKGHYTDRVDNPEDYPLSGMGGANVGPEFTEEEYMALMNLVELERKLDMRSGFRKAIKDAVVESGRWKKWLHQSERGKAFESLPRDRQDWLLRTGSRYVWTEESVVAARERLYENLAPIRDADAFVIWRIKTSIMKYYHSFNLIDFCDQINHLPESAPGVRT